MNHLARSPHRGERLVDYVWIVDSDVIIMRADALGAVLDETIRRLQDVRGTLDDGDAVASWNEGAREDRDRLLGAGLAGGDVQELRVSVPNRPGVVAEVALALGRRSVNIVDMALYPAADNASGVIAIWVGGDPAPAERVVGDLGFPVARA